MTVSRLRKELSDSELIHFAAYYEIKGNRMEQEMNRAKSRTR